MTTILPISIHPQSLRYDPYMFLCRGFAFLSLLGKEVPVGVPPPQQMRGRSSPVGGSSRRVVPMVVRTWTRPGGPALTSPMRRASPP
jgi:hypothetical protein